METSTLKNVHEILEWLILPYRGIVRAWRVIQHHQPDELWHIPLVGFVILIVWGIMQSQSAQLFALPGELTPIELRLILPIFLIALSLLQAYYLLVAVGLIVLFMLTLLLGTKDTEKIVNQFILANEQLGD